MSQQGLTEGRDNTVLIILPDGTQLRLGQVTDFDAKPDTNEEKIVQMDGAVRHLQHDQGWSGTFNMIRSNPALDAYFAAREANRRVGIDDAPCTIIQFVREATGAISQFRYERCVLTFTDPGKFSGAQSVKQTLSFKAETRKLKA